MFDLAVVVETRSDDYSVDAVNTRTGARIVGAQVMAMGASGRTGLVDLPDVRPKSKKWDITTRDKDQQDVLAIIGYVGQTPIVFGFIFPQINQMLFKDGKLRIFRHQSDVMTTLDGDGNFEFAHPSGAFIRIGEAPESVDLSSKNVDKSLATNRNKDRKVHMRIELADQAVQLTLTPDGDAQLKIKRDLLIEAEGKADIKITGDVTAEVGGSLSATVSGTTSIESTGAVSVETGASATVKAQAVTLDAPQTTCTGNLTVQGALSYTGGMTGSSSGGSAATFNGPTTFNSNVTVNANLTATGSITDGNGDGGA